MADLQQFQMAASEDHLANDSPEFLKDRKDSWSRTPAIVYDSIAGRLYRMPESEVIAFPKAIMPGTGTKADIYLQLPAKVTDQGEIEGKRENAQAWLARIDLGRLGWTTRWKRRMGEIKYVYIKKGEQNARSVGTS